jgi:hypothetical protein
MNSDLIPRNWAVVDLSLSSPLDLEGLPLPDGSRILPPWHAAPVVVFTHWRESRPDTRAAALRFARSHHNVLLNP